MERRPSEKRNCGSDEKKREKKFFFTSPLPHRRISSRKTGTRRRAARPTAIGRLRKVSLLPRDPPSYRKSYPSIYIIWPETTGFHFFSRKLTDRFENGFDPRLPLAETHPIHHRRSSLDRSCGSEKFRNPQKRPFLPVRPLPDVGKIRRFQIRNLRTRFPLPDSLVVPDFSKGSILVRHRTAPRPPAF